MYNLETIRSSTYRGVEDLPSPIWVSSAKEGQAIAHFRDVRIDQNAVGRVKALTNSLTCHLQAPSVFHHLCRGPFLSLRQERLPGAACDLG